MTDAQPSAAGSAAVPAAGTERAAIAGRAGIVAAGTLTSRVLGLGREQVLAAMFNRLESDAFIIAFTIPNLLRQVLAEGAVQTGVLPVLAEVRQRRGEEEARVFFQRVRGLSIVVLLFVTLLGVWAAPTLVRLFAGGFADYPGQLERTVELTRLLFPYIVFMGTAALGMAALNTYGRYLVTAFAPGLLNVGFIVCALSLPAFLLSHGQDRTLALVIGVWIGGVLQVVAQWPSLARIDMLRRPRRALDDPDVRLVIKRMAPVILGMGVYYLDVMVGRNLLSESGVGATSYFNFALRLCDLPQGIFVMALQAATLPSLSRLAAQKDMAELKQTFAFGARLSLFAAIPASLLLAALAEPIVVLVFQRGQFDAVAAHETGRALLAQASGVWTVAMVRQLVGLSYALGDTRLPVIVSALDFLVFLGLALWLRGPLGHVGISWAVSGSSLVQMTLLWFAISRRMNGLLSADIGRALGRALMAALPAALFAALLVPLLQPVARGPWGRALPGAVAAACFALVFLAVAAATKSPELAAIRSGVLRRRARKSPQ